MKMVTHFGCMKAVSIVTYVITPFGWKLYGVLTYKYAVILAPSFKSIKQKKTIT